jgi:hypothetical protein
MITSRLKMFAYLIFATALTFSFQSCATQGGSAKAPEGTLLTHNDLVELFSSPRQAQYRFSRGIATIHYSPDGRETVSKGSFFDTGEYHIKGDILCSKWSKSRSGEEKCSKLYKISDNAYTFIYTDGEKGGTLKFQ